MQDAIALAIENNLDLEIERYGSVLAEWGIERADAGGLLRGVPGGSSQIGQVASGQGVVGSQNAAGVTSNTGGSAQPSGNAIITQIGPVTANLDPVFQESSSFSHTSTPQSNTVQSQTDSLVQNTRISNATFQQGLITGGYVRVTGSESYLKENTPTDVLNPSVAPRLQIYVQHNLLQGLGRKVNERFIRVAKNNVAASDQTFRSSLINVVTNVLSLYWDLVGDEEDLKAKRAALDLAQKFFDDTRKQIAIGSIARVEVSRAEGQLAGSQEQYSLALGTEQLQQNLLKTALSRNGLEDSVISDLPVVPLDHLEISDADNLPPLRQLIATALAQRPDIAATHINAASAEISAAGTQNGLLPTVQAFASVTNSGLSGKAVPNSTAGSPDPYVVGGLGNALGQVFRRNFPNERVGVSVPSVPVFVDHIDQADYALDQLLLRQTQLNVQRDLNQLAVDVSNQVVALRQARARHAAAAKARGVQEQLLAGEEKKFSLASSTVGGLVAARQSLAAAQGTELNALAAYKHARIALDQVLGQTLETNHVSVDEGVKGRATLGAGKQDENSHR